MTSTIRNFTLSVVACLGLLGVDSLAAEDFSSWRKFSGGKLISETDGVSPGHRAHIGIWLTLAPEWHTYWVNPGDSGEPLNLRVTSRPEVVVHDVKFPTPKRFTIQTLTSFAYSHEVLFPIEFMVPSTMQPGESIEFNVDAEWLICQKVCIPATEKFSLTVPVKKLESIKPTEQFRLFQRAQHAMAQTPDEAIEVVEVSSDAGETVRLRFPKWSADYEWIDFFPYRGASLKNASAKVVNTNPLELEFLKSNSPKKANVGFGLLLMRTPDTNVVNAWSWGPSGWQMLGEGAKQKHGPRLLWILFSAFLGGLILNLMPCVFPILSMKLISLVKLAQSSPREVLKQNLAYTAGVIISFLSIAMMILLLRQSGQLVGWGFQLQSPVFVAFLVWLFVALAMQLLGFFELDFLNLNFGHQLTRTEGLWGPFFTGVLAVVVASPCTAPFMGVAVGFALAAPSWSLLLVFFMLGLGLASPYLLFSVFPPVVKLLPKPGPWMKRFKEWMAVPLIFTAIWLLWLVGQLSGLTAVSVVLTGCFALVLAIWLSRRYAKVSWLAATIFLIMCAGWLSQRVVDESPLLNEDKVWQRFSPSLLEQNKDRVVFVDMTADWCLTCKVNERVVLETEEIQQFFVQEKVLLVKGDWTQRNPAITEFLNRFERAGVPFYVVFSPAFPNGIVLPEMLSKEDVKRAIAKAKGN